MRRMGSFSRCRAICTCTLMMRMRCMRGRFGRELLLSTRRRINLTGVAAGGGVGFGITGTWLSPRQKKTNKKNPGDAEREKKKKQGGFGGSYPIFAEFL